jgi:hypothetical protein
VSEHRRRRQTCGEHGWPAAAQGLGTSDDEAAAARRAGSRPDEVFDEYARKYEQKFEQKYSPGGAGAGAASARQKPPAAQAPPPPRPPPQQKLAKSRNEIIDDDLAELKKKLGLK